MERSLHMRDVCTFDEISSADADTVGGKALSLGCLTQAGLAVPPGFCVTTVAYRRLRGQSLHDDLALCTAITAAYRELGEGPVAVRSSATMEDSSAASFAGQQETLVGVTGEAAVLDAVGRCWASLNSERALAYRRRQGVDDQGLAMAVVVQRLVPAAVAGVLFTRDPLDPEGQRMLVEASWGLGESVVSGRVTPDRFQLDWKTGAVLQKHLSPLPASIPPPVAQDTPQRSQPIAPADLLALLVRPPGVADRHLVYAAVAPRDLRR